jgi:hypothetical protein
MRFQQLFSYHTATGHGIQRPTGGLNPPDGKNREGEGMSLFRARKDLVVKVFHAGEDDEPFICAVNGEVTVDALAEIEDELRGEHEFSKGPGEYVYCACYDQGEKDELGNVHFLPFWELTEISFEQPDWMSMTHEPEKHVPPSDEPCDDCGEAGCIFKHHCQIPF